MRLLVALLLALSVAACGKDSPVTAPTPTVSSITVTSPDANVFLGATSQFTATTALSNGTSNPASCAWTSDTPGVATVNSAGVVTGTGSGQANIICTQSGREGHKLIRVLPNYGGNWSGSYIITGCGQSGFFANNAINFCGSFRAGSVLPFSLVLAQTGDAVSGRFFQGTIQFDQTSATVDFGGGVTLASSNTSGTIKIDTIFQLAQPTAGRLTGTQTQAWTAGSPFGTANLAATIQNGQKTSSVEHTATLHFFDAASLFDAMRR